MSASLVMFPADQDHREIGRWLELHRCDIENVMLDGREHLGVRIPLFCQKLIFDKNTGQATCTIHSTRPIICQEYFCKRVSG